MNEIRQLRDLLRAQKACLREERKKFGPQLRELLPAEWSDEMRAARDSGLPSVPLRAWRSRDFLVQLTNDPCGHQRLSFNRAEINQDGGWRDGLTWDDLMRLKAEAGFGDCWAVECYPPTAEVINVANIRHLFILKERPSFGWHSRIRPSEPATSNNAQS